MQPKSLNDEEIETLRTLSGALRELLAEARKDLERAQQMVTALAAIMRANAELIAELRSALPAILDALDHVGDAAAHSPDGGKEEGEPGFGRDLHRARGAREMAGFVRRLDIGRGFVRARECPDCFHTKCGESCVCNCDAAHAEAEAAHLRGQVENTTWRPIEECGELERGTYLVTLDSGRIAAAWHDELGWYCGGPAKPTHVHRMGPIRGPGEG